MSIKISLRFSRYFIGLIWLVGMFSCNDSYKGPYPAEPTCVQYTAIDTVELYNGTVHKEDTVYYISNYINAFTYTKYYPCALALALRKDGMPIQYSGYVRKNTGHTKDYIELTAAQAIPNETIITNYIGLLRNRDSISILLAERTSTIDSYKIENDKLKVLLSYSGCTIGRKHTLAIYKTTQKLGVTTTYAYLISNPEFCLMACNLWYEFDMSAYKKGILIVHDAVKTHEISIP